MALSKVKDAHKVCSVCKQSLPVANFGKTKDVFIRKKDGVRVENWYYRGPCKSCATLATKEWLSKPGNAEKAFQQARRWREELKVIVYKHYGNKCVCCGETNTWFLTLDHINNDGYKERLRPFPGANRKKNISRGFYRHLIDSGFPVDLQLMCYNCNCGKQRNFGTCPHQKIIEPHYGSRATLK